MWLKSSDNRASHPDVVGLVKTPTQHLTLLGALYKLELYCAMHGTDGFLPEMTVQEIPRKWRQLLTDPPHGGTPLLHRRGDDCDCMRDMEWSPGPHSYYLHTYLEDNPTREEHDLRVGKRAERNDAELRAQVLDRDRGLCRYCGTQVGAWADNRSGRGAVLDHVDPVLAIGITNLVLACRQCNSKKGNRTPVQAGMTLLPAPEPPARPATKPADRPTDQPVGRSTGRPADDPTHERGTGRDGTGPRSGRLRPPTTTGGNPYHRRDPNPDHHAGLPPDPAGWPADSTPAPTCRVCHNPLIDPDSRRLGVHAGCELAEPPRSPPDRPTDQPTDPNPVGPDPTADALAGDSPMNQDTLDAFQEA